MRFFGSKQKSSKLSRDTQGPIEDRHFPTPIHEQHAIYTRTAAINTPGLYTNNHLRENMRQSPSDDQPWEVVANSEDAAHNRVLAPSRASTLPSRTSPSLPSPSLPRSPSPYSFVSNKPASVKDREPPHVLRRKPPSNPPAALGILRSLDPPMHSTQPPQTQLEERTQLSNGGLRDRDRESAEKKEKRGFWSASKDRPSWIERSKDRDQKDDAELTRMIGYLTATASEDWMLVLEVCDRASSNEANAKEAVRALRREFKYGEPAAQLSAARLWAIMSRNCSGVFVVETSSRKFITTLEELIASSRTSPVVRERLLDVIAAAAYNGPKDSTFRSLWRRVKPAEKPEEGVPFDLDDEMINPPTTNSRRSQIDTNAIPVAQLLPAISNTLDVTPDTPRKRRSPARERIISLEEDIRRLFQECHIGMGNAALLSDALGACKPEKMKTDPVIREFYVKCRASQELIDSQIPWATAGAEHSRSQLGISQPLRNNDSHADGEEQTMEERLLAELLKANEELQFVLKQYSDLERVAIERRTEDLSRKVTRMERQYSQYQDPDGCHSSEYSQSINETPSSRSPSPSIRSETPPRNSHTHDSRSQTSLDIQGQLLAPPPAAPHGPRSPQSSLTSRASPVVFLHEQRQHVDSRTTDSHNHSAVPNIRLVDKHAQPVSTVNDANESDSEIVDNTPVRPSAKALGKRRLVESVASNLDLDEPSDLESSLCTGNRHDSDPDEEELRPPVKYVYDAVAERTHQRIQEATAALVVNGVH